MSKNDTFEMKKMLKWIGVVAISSMLILMFVFSDFRQLGGNTSTEIGRVNGKSMYYEENSRYVRYYSQIEESYSQYVEEMTPSMRRLIEQAAFANTVNSMLLEEKAGDYGIIVSDQIIATTLRNLYFVDENGQIDVDSYRRFISNPENNRDILKLERGIKSEILNRSVEADLFRTAKIDSLAIEMKYAVQNIKRKIAVAYIDISEPVQNRMYPVEDLQKYFVENITNFVQYSVSDIVISSTSKAERTYEFVSGKQNIDNFSEIAKERSEDDGSRADGGDLGYLTKYDMPTEFFIKVSETSKTNTVLAPIYYDNTYHILMLRDIKVPEFEDIDIEIINEAYIDDNIDGLLVAAKEEIKPTLNAIREQYKDVREFPESDNYKIYITDYFSFDSSIIDEETKISVPDSDNEVFFRTVYSLDRGTVSVVLSFENGVGIIQVLDIQSEELDPEEAAREQAIVAQNELSDKMQGLASKWLEIERSRAKIKNFLNPSEN